MSMYGCANRLRNEQIKYDHTIFVDSEESKIYLRVMDTNTDEYTFVFNNKYPLIPPAEILVNDIPYKELWIMKSRDGRNTLKKINNGHDCFCCRSIICGDNWNPLLTVNQIIDEIKHVFTTKQIVACIVDKKFDEV
jgi:hypothetical protein